MQDVARLWGLYSTAELSAENAKREFARDAERNILLLLGSVFCAPKSGEISFDNV